MIGSKNDDLVFSDGAEIYLLIDWMATEFNIRVEKKGNLYVAYSNETNKMLFFSADVKVIYNALIYLANKESEENAKSKER